jgi:adenine phosphoribosyltransferase
VPTGLTPSASAHSNLPGLISARIRDIPDYPQPGIVFKDITPLLADGDAFAAVVSAMAEGSGDAEGGRGQEESGLGQGVGGLGQGVGGLGQGVGGLGQGVGGLGRIDKVVGIEARGFILAAPVACCLGAGFVPVRKQGKLPAETLAESYQLEYGTATVEVHVDAFRPGDRVLIVDDVLATGGTAAASVRLVRRSGAEVAAVSVLLELGFLGGRARLPDVEVRSLLAV